MRRHITTGTVVPGRSTRLARVIRLLEKLNLVHGVRWPDPDRIHAKLAR